MKKHLIAFAVATVAAGSAMAQANDTLAKVKASGSISMGVRESSGALSYTLGDGNRANLVCLDFETGAQLWAQPGFGDYASITAVNDKLLALTSAGELLLLKASPAKYEELGRAQLCAKTWASPAYADGKIYVKDENSVAAYALVP